LRLDLLYLLGGQPEHPPDRFERTAPIAAEAKAKLQHTPLAMGNAGQSLIEWRSQQAHLQLIPLELDELVGDGSCPLKRGSVERLDREGCSEIVGDVGLDPS